MSEAPTQEALTTEDEALLEELVKFFNEGGTVKTLRDISPATIETLYAQGYNLYQTGKFDDALQIFKLLTILDHYDVRFPMGAGLCQQRLDHHEAAVECFSAAAIVDIKNPEPPYCAAESLIQMSRWTEAESGLFSATQLAGNKPEFQALKERASQLLERIKHKGE